MSEQLDNAIAQFMQEQQNLAQHQPGHWRCFYNQQGSIVDVAFGPPWHCELPYVDITVEQLEQIRSCDKVINGRLVMIDHRNNNVLKLVESTNGEFCTVANHMSIVLEPAENYSNVKYYTQITDRHSRS